MSYNICYEYNPLLDETGLASAEVSDRIRV
jgi:hypothetical protein